MYFTQAALDKYHLWSVGALLLQRRKELSVSQVRMAERVSQWAIKHPNEISRERGITPDGRKYEFHRTAATYRQWERRPDWKPTDVQLACFAEVLDIHPILLEIASGRRRKEDIPPFDKVPDAREWGASIPPAVLNAMRLPDDLSVEEARYLGHQLRSFRAWRDAESRNQQSPEPDANYTLKLVTAKDRPASTPDQIAVVRNRRLQYPRQRYRRPRYTT